MPDIDPIEFGKLLGAVEHLTASVDKLSAKVETVETKLSTGRGVALGLIIAAGGVGGSIGAFAHKFIDVLK